MVLCDICWRGTIEQDAGGTRGTPSAARAWESRAREHGGNHRAFAGAQSGRRSTARTAPRDAAAIAAVSPRGVARRASVRLRGGQKGRAQAPVSAAPAAASAGDADRRAARRGDVEPLPAPLLAVARARRSPGGRRGGADGDPGLVEAALRAHCFCAADDGLLPRCRQRRDGRTRRAGIASSGWRCGLRRVHSCSVPQRPVGPSCDRVVGAVRPRGARRVDREDRLPRIASPRLPARARGLHTRGRVACHVGDRRVPDGDCPLLPVAGGERSCARDRSLSVARRDLAHTLPRRRAALLRPGGERPDEEERCRPTSCCRA